MCNKDNDIAVHEINFGLLMGGVDHSSSDLIESFDELTKSNEEYEVSIGPSPIPDMVPRNESHGVCYQMIN